MINILEEYRVCFSNYLYNDQCVSDLTDVVNKIKQYKRIFWIGNGGSFCVCQHMQEDFFKMAQIESLCLSNAGFITCLANDEGYENVFKIWLNLNNLNSDDLVIAISSSGTSPNMINGASVVDPNNLITLTGFKKGNKLSTMGKINIWIDSKSYGVVESLHASFLHLCLDTLIEEQKNN